MRKIIVSTLSVLSLLVVMTSCSQKGGRGTIPGMSKGLSDSASYSVGVSLGHLLLEANFKELNMRKVYEAIEDMLDEKELKIDAAEANHIITTYVAEKEQRLYLKNSDDAKLFFDKNRDKEGVVETESGLQYKVITEGNGETPAPIDTVEVHYIGSLIDGTQFESSYDRAEPTVIPLNRFIPGWVEGLQQISEGGKVKLFIPSSLAYGERSMGVITPGSALIFEIELIKVIKAKEEEEEN